MAEAKCLKNQKKGFEGEKKEWQVAKIICGRAHTATGGLQYHI